MKTTIEIEFAPYALIVRGNPMDAGVPLDALAGIGAMADAYGFDLIDPGAARPLRAAMVITNAEQAAALRQAIEAAAHEAAAGNALEEWLAGPDTGSSSLTVVEVLDGRLGLTELHQGPSDPSDFRRCRELLEVMPEWKARLSEVVEAYPPWAPLVEAWTWRYPEDVEPAAGGFGARHQGRPGQTVADAGTGQEPARERMFFPSAYGRPGADHWLTENGMVWP